MQTSTDVPVLLASRADTKESVILFSDLHGNTPATPTSIVYISDSSNTAQVEKTTVDSNGFPTQFLISSSATGTVATATFTYSNNYQLATVTITIAGTTTQIVQSVPILSSDVAELERLFTELTTQQLSGAFTAPTAGEYAKIAAI